MLKVENLEVHGLKPVSFDLNEGECVAIRGPSGSGKTVLLRALADLDPVPGRVFLDATERGGVSGPEWRKRVRYLAAEPAWWAETPRQHFPAKSKAEKELKKLGLAQDKFDQSVTKLSTGERQRLALLRAIEDNPKLLLLDEPTGALDAKATSQVEKILERLRKGGTSIILVSHDPSQIDRLAGRTFTIRGGRLTGTNR